LQGGIVTTESSPEHSPLTPKGAQQQVEGDVDLGEVLVTHDPDRDQAPRLMAEAFYRGLGADSAAVTPPLRRRDLVIARDLVAVGATPLEAEAFAREMSGKSMRIAPVDLRSFERERLGWQARCRGAKLEERRVVDRTGQPPSWQSEPPASADANGTVLSRTPKRSAKGTVIDARREQLRHTLTSVLFGQNC
jgi:hypothetical protein